MCPFNYTVVAVSGKVERSLIGLTTPVGWLMSLQLTVLNQDGVIVFDTEITAPTKPDVVGG